MGIHSGPVEPVEDVNDKENVAGAGVNMAQRVMDCGDAGHILLSSARGRRPRSICRMEVRSCTNSARSKSNMASQVRHRKLLRPITSVTPRFLRRLRRNARNKRAFQKVRQARARAKRRGLELILLLAAILIIGLSIFGLSRFADKQ